MFAYRPTVNDESGAILGSGMVNSAQTTAGAQMQLADSIGNSLVSLAAAYGAKKGTEAKGKNFKKFMGMAGDTFGMDSSMFADMEDYDAGMMLENFGSWMPAMANAQLGNRRVDAQIDQSFVNSPGARAAATNEAERQQQGRRMGGARYNFGG